MDKENDMLRILIETVIRKTIKEINDSPERSIRNWVNMALNFSEGKFQRTFFKTADDMLKNTKSPYYDLIKDSAANTDEERLLQFGMNLCYNSCTIGVRKILENEILYGFNIPWTVSFRMSGEHISENSKIYDTIITQGEDLGIYTWMLYLNGELGEALPLVQKHTDSAFILFCEPKDITDDFLDNMCDVKNVMLAVRYEENNENLYYRLRENRLLYSTYYIYDDENAESIINGDFFYDAVQLHPLFTAVIPAENCSEETGERVYKAVTSYRRRQSFQTIVWDVNRDNSNINSIISDEACNVGFDFEGGFYVRHREKVSLNLFGHNLRDILKHTYSANKNKKKR